MVMEATSQTVPRVNCHAVIATLSPPFFVLGTKGHFILALRQATDEFRRQASLTSSRIPNFHTERAGATRELPLRCTGIFIIFTSALMDSFYLSPVV